MDTNTKTHIDALINTINKLEYELDSSNKTITKLQKSIDAKIKAAYKDGYGTAMQKVLSIVEEIDNNYEEQKRNTVDKYLDLHSGEYIFDVKNIKEIRYLVEEVMSKVFKDATPGEISIWVSNGPLSKNWTSLFVNIDESLCTKLANVIDENPERYNSIKFKWYLNKKS